MFSALHMFIHSFDSRLRAKHQRVIAMFALSLAMLVAAPNAQATTFLFTVPTTTIQNALASAIAAGPHPDDPLLYGFYDVYIRPALPGDGVGGNDLPSYTPVSDVSPLTSGNDQWSAGFNTPTFDAHINFRFTAAGTTLLALVTTNPNVAGKTIDGKTG